VGGTDDYSKWNFTLTTAYTTIKDGQNKITAKFSCSNNPILMSHNSINVTGVTSAANTSTTSEVIFGDRQVITITASDALSHKRVIEATVDGK
jgi:hypothetical protein